MSRVLFLIFVLIISFARLEAQTERDSLLRLLSSAGSPSEQWEVLEPFLRKEARTWGGTYADFGERLLQLSKDHFPGRLAYAAFLLGELHFGNDDFDQAIAAYQQGLQHLEEADDPALVYRLLLGIGNIFYRRNQYDKAMEYYTRSLRQATEAADTQYMVLGHLSVANILTDQQRYDSSGSQLYRARDLAEAARLANELPTIYNNIIYLEDERGNTELARTYIYKLLELARQSGNKDDLLLALGNLGYSYGKYEQRYDSAVYYLKQSMLQFDPDLSETNFLFQIYTEIANNYEKMGNADSALAYLHKSIQLQDTLQQKHFNAQIQEIESKYQTEEKEKLLAQAQLEADRQANLRRLTLGLALAVIAVLFVLFLYFRNRQKLVRQQAEMSLQIQQAEAEQLKALNQLRSNFFANISHEFRTPLTLILSPLEQLKNGTLKGKAEDYFSMMHRNARRLQDLINQLLDLSKLESGRMELRLKDGDIYRFSRQLAGSFESWALQKLIDYEVHIPNGQLLVRFDHDKYEKILNNLISNALKFTPDGGTITVQISAQHHEDGVLLQGRVRDSGTGIPPIEQDKIFQRFYQGGHHQDGTASSGIGLALTRELVLLQQGQISLDSKEGQGTEFEFSLPLAFAKKDSYSPPAKASTSLPAAIRPGLYKSQSADKQQPIVLVIEDNEDVRHYIVTQLREDYRILEAGDGPEGLQAALEHIPDLVITDVMMPGLTGDELTARLKNDERTSHIPVIMLTAKATSADKIEGLQTGADDYLTKPFNATELQVRIKNLIHQRQQLKARFSQQGLELSPKEIQVSSVDQQFLNRMLDILEREIDNEKLSVEELARRVGMSRSQLHRKLTALTDKTPSAFLRSFRMQRAYQLLTKKAGNASEVAFMVGFNSLAYFSKCFKDEYGLSPSEVLKQS